jgi:N-acetylglucosamine-6-phosphate deacetylase
MILRNQTFVTHQNIYVGDIEISNNVISKITVKENMKPNFNQILLPGFIDIHTHGGYGFDFNNLINKKNELSFYLSNLVKEGVTSVIATTISCPEKDLNLIGKNIKNIINKSIIKG